MCGWTLALHTALSVELMVWQPLWLAASCFHFAAKSTGIIYKLEVNCLPHFLSETHPLKTNVEYEFHLSNESRMPLTCLPGADIFLPLKSTFSCLWSNIFASKHQKSKPHGGKTMGKQTLSVNRWVRDFGWLCFGSIVRFYRHSGSQKIGCD